MSTIELEEFTLLHLEACARIHRYHINKSSLPISSRTLLRLRKQLFTQILNAELCEDQADAAQKVLSTSAKALERKKATAEGRVTIEAEKAQEVALMRMGFKFEPVFGDFVKVLGRRREHWLNLFLDGDGQPTATLNDGGRILTIKGEIGRWLLPDLGDGLAKVLEEAEQRVANLLVQVSK